MAAPAQARYDNNGGRRGMSFSTGVIVTVLLSTVAWVFSAGVLYQQVQDLRLQVDELRQDIRELRSQPQHVSQPATTGLAAR